MADENTEIQEQQTQETTPQQQGIQFEDILPWGTTGGDTGLSARLKLKRNFEKIKAWLDSLQLNVTANDKLSRTEDDTAEGEIGFLKGLWIKAKGLFGWDAEGNITAKNIKGESLEVDKFEAEKLAAAEAVINEVRSDNYNGSGLGDEGFIVTNSHNGHSYIEVDELFVRMKAVFAELEIRKETYTGGNQKWSPAGSVLYRVDYLDDDGDVLGYTEAVVPWLLKGMPFLMDQGQSLGLLSFASRRQIRISLTTEEWQKVKTFRCYIVADDGTTRTRNWWQVGDQARCQTFNIESRASRDYEITQSPEDIERRNGMAGNIFYWRIVTGIGNVQLDDGRFYDYVDLSNESGGFMPGSDIPAAGDSIVCWGSRTKTGRMGLISIETQLSSDDAIGQTPAIKMYSGINSFSMNGKRTAIISPELVEFESERFRLITGNGSRIPVANERGLWVQGEKYYYYDRVNWIGCIWLCIIEDGYYWESLTETETIGEGNDAYERPKQYAYNKAQIDDGEDGREGSYGHLNGFPDDPTKKVVLVRNFTTAEPGENVPTIWLKQVNKGVTITGTKVSYAASSQGVTPPANLAQNWHDSIEALETAIGKHLGDHGAEFLWTRRMTSYSDNLQPTYEYFVTRYGSVVVDTKVEFYVTKEVLSMPADDHNITWYDDFSDIALQAVGNAYIWTRHTLIYQDGKKTYSYLVTRVGNGVSAVEELFCLGESATTCPDSKVNPVTGEFGRKADGTIDYTARLWSERRPDYDPASGKIWLWNFELTTMSDGSTNASKPRPIANMSRGIEYIHQWYALSKYDDSDLGNKRFPSDIRVPSGNTDEPWATLPGCEGISSDSENKPTTWSDEKHSRTPSNDYPYQWNLEVVKYSTADNDGSFYDVFYHVSSRMGTPANNVNGFTEYYKLTNSGDENNKPACTLNASGVPKESGWIKGKMPTYNGDANRFLWNAEVRESTEYGEKDYTGTIKYNVEVIFIGDHARGIASIVEEYGLSTSKEKNTDGKPKVMPSVWRTSEDSIVPDETYRIMWNRTTVNYTDGTQKVTYHVCMEKSVDVKDVKELFIRYSSGTSLPASYYTNVGADKAPSVYINAGWSTTPPAYDDSTNAGRAKVWLWNMEVTVLDDGTYSTTPPHCVGNFANGIKSFTDYYVLSTNGVTDPDHGGDKIGNWSTTMPTVVRDTFMWNKEVVTMLDNTTTTLYHVLALYSADGKDAPLAVLSDTIVSVPCDTNGKVFGGAFSERIDIDLLLNGVTDIQPKNVSISGDSKEYVSIKNNGTQNSVYLQVSIADKSTLTEETVKVDITGYDSTQSTREDGTKYYAERKGTAYFHIRKWVSGDGYKMLYYGPVSASVTPPTESTWNQSPYKGNWNAKPSDQISSSLQCIYVAIWRTTVDGTEKTTNPYYVGLYSRWGDKGDTSATARLYKRGTSVSKPSAKLTYYFSDGSISGNLDGWTRTIPASTSDHKPCWVIEAQVKGTETASIYSSDWEGPTKILEDGDIGKSGLTVKISPQVLIYNQDSKASANFPSSASAAGPKAKIEIYRDGTAVSFTLGDATAYGTASNGTDTAMSGCAGSDNSSKLVWLKGVSYTLNNGVYEYTYDHGYIEFSFTAESKQYTYQVAWFLNRLGKRIKETLGDIETNYMSRTEYALEKEVIRKDYEGKIQTSAEGISADFSQQIAGVNNTVSGHTTKIASLELTAKGLSSMVSSYGENMIDNASWKEWDDNSKATFTPSTMKVSNKSGYDDLYSSPVYLESGKTYVFSLYTNDSFNSNQIVAYRCNGNPNAAPEQMGNTISGTVYTVSGDTYQNCSRRYCTYTPGVTDFYKIDVYGPTSFYRAKLESGSTPSSWAASNSEIKQAADEIKLSVKEDLSESGVNIDSHSVNLYGDKVTFSDKDGGNTDKIYIDPDTGSLHAVNGVFEGSLFYHKIILINSNSESGAALYESDGKSLKGDIFSITSSSWGIANLKLPYPSDCVGATIRIIRRDSSRVNLYLKNYYSSYIHEGPELIPLNAFYTLQEFQLASNGGKVTLERRELSFDTYNSVELIATKNPVSPNWSTNVYNYVWMVVDAR